MTSKQHLPPTLIETSLTMSRDDAHWLKVEAARQRKSRSALMRDLIVAYRHSREIRALVAAAAVPMKPAA